MLREIRFLLVCIGAGLLANAALAVDYTPGTMAQFRADLTTSNGQTSSDTITLPAGQFDLTGVSGENANASGDLDITKTGGDLVIQGTPGGAGTTIHCQSLDRAFHINAAAGVTITFRDLSIVAGVVDDNGTTTASARGGAIMNESGNDVILENVSINTCQANGEVGTTGTTGSNPGGNGGLGNPGAPALGGAIYHEGGSLTITRCNITSNRANGGAGGSGGPGGPGGAGIGGDGGDGNNGGNAFGAGVYLQSGSLTVTESTFDNNMAWGGAGGQGGAGGVGVTNGSSGNGAAGGSGQGGNIYIGTGTSATIERSFLGHTTTTAGIFSCVGGDGGDGVVAGNGADVHGGDILFDGTSLTLRNCTFGSAWIIAGDGGDGTSAGFGGHARGGSLAIDSGNVTIFNCTFTEGDCDEGTPGAGGGSPVSGESSGGNVYNNAGSVVAHSTIFANGTATTTAPDYDGDVTASACLFEDATGANITVGATANITGSDPALQALASNGGWVETYAITGGPCVDAGTNPDNLVTDGRGAWFNRVQGSAADIGAFEMAQAFPQRPIITDPASAVSVSGSTYDIQGRAEPLSFVRIYTDTNNDGSLAGETVVGSLQLMNFDFEFTITVSLTAASANNFLATADNGAESAPADVPTITENTVPTSPPVVTNPSSPTNTTGTTYSIQGTADPDTLVRIYSDFNNNGLIDGADAVVASQQLSGGGTNFSIVTPITQSTTNNFTATADDTVTESTPTDVPTITETTPAAISPPVITDPSSATTVDAANYTITGTAQADSLVRIYSDDNNDGFINGSDTVVASEQLTGGGTSFSISVSLTQNADNNFLATADDGAGNESLPADVPTITENSPAGGGGGGGDDDEGCTTGTTTSWLLLLTLAASLAMVAIGRHRGVKE